MRKRLWVAGLLALVFNGAGAAEPARHLVVFNKPGPNFNLAAQHSAEIAAHRALYRGLAERGDILVGGRLVGESPLGISVFRSGITRREVEALLEADAAVKLGLVALEFREWEVHMGSLVQAETPKVTAGLPNA